MQVAASSFFQGLTQEDLARVLGQPEQRLYPAGSTVLVEGEVSHDMYVIQAGAADIVIRDRRGGEHRLSRVGAGATVGEMALFTGQPASATVRAISDLEVLVLSESDFHRVATVYPRIYQNLGAILSERLARSNRRTLHDAIGRLTMLHTLDAPPLLCYALACSLAWHTRGSVLLLVLSDDPHAELVALSEARGHTADGHHTAGSRAIPSRNAVNGVAQIQLERPGGAFSSEHLPPTLEDLCGHYDHVLVQVDGASAPPPPAGHWMFVAGPQAATTSLAMHGPACIVRGWLDNRSLIRPDRERVLCVPSLGPADEAALREGALPARSAAGQVLGWAARDIAGMKVGLALGGGVAKGYAHIGVFRALERLGVPIDYLAGTSIGAAVASLYAVGKSQDEAARTMDELGAVAFRITVPFTSLLSNARLAQGVRRLAGKTRLEDLDIPLGIVATDIAGGREVVFQRGLIWPAVVASMALPGIYPPQRLGPYVLVDGGVVNPVPSSVTVGMGANTVLAVKLGVQPTTPTEARAAAPRGRSPRLVESLIRSLDLMQSTMSDTTAVAGSTASTILIEPAFKEGETVGLRNFSQGRRYIALGDAAVEAALPRISAALPWVGKA
jgi:NTE family protein